jgi:hypothetical protein
MDQFMRNDTKDHHQYTYQDRNDRGNFQHIDYKN